MGEHWQGCNIRVTQGSKSDEAEATGIKCSGLWLKQTGSLGNLTQARAIVSPIVDNPTALPLTHVARH